MNNTKIYAAAISARTEIENNITRVVYKPLGIPARNNEEATGKALEYAKKEYPQENGWHSHQAIVVELNIDWILDNIGLE